MRQAVDQARGDAGQKLWPSSISYQEKAVAHARALVNQTKEREAQVQLSVLLYNLAGYYQQANLHAEAVAAYPDWRRMRVWAMGDIN